MKTKTTVLFSLVLLLSFISCSAGSNLSITDTESTHSDAFGVDFGEVKIGSNLEKTLIVKNIVSNAVEKMRADNTLPEGFEFRGGQYPVTGGTCGEELEPSSTCTIVVDFRPTREMVSEGSLTLLSVTGWSVPTPPQTTEPFSATSRSSISIRGIGIK